MVHYERVIFNDVYTLANEIWRGVCLNLAEHLFGDCFGLGSNDFIQRVAKPTRHTLLHYFIEEFYEHLLNQFQHHGNEEAVIEDYASIIRNYYDLSPDDIIRYDTENNPRSDEEDDYDYAHRYDSPWGVIYTLRSYIPVSLIAHNAFQVLFGNRDFLHKFNSIAAQYVSTMKMVDHPVVLARDGILRRQSLPTWVKRGVFFRDKGRCIFCTRDLTGTIVTGEELHYDHIVPLAEGGTNDPTNFQLLCGQCNLKKGKRPLGTSNLYPVYWEVDE